jgi:hypothetical protein
MQTAEVPWAASAHRRGWLSTRNSPAVELTVDATAGAAVTGVALLAARLLVTKDWQLDPLHAIKETVKGDRDVQEHPRCLGWIRAR